MKKSVEMDAGGDGCAGPTVDASDVVELAERLYGPAIALCGRSHDAEELVYDTIVALLPRWHTLTGSRLAYARQTLAHRYLDNRRRARVAWSHQHEMVSSTVANEDGRIEDLVDLERALLRLPGRTREILVLRYLLDRSVTEVAYQLSLPVGSVRRLSHEGLRALRRSPALGESRRTDVE